MSVLSAAQKGRLIVAFIDGDRDKVDAVLEEAGLGAAERQAALAAMTEITDLEQALAGGNDPIFANVKEQLEQLQKGSDHG